MAFSTTLALFCLILLPWFAVFNKSKHLKHLTMMQHGISYISQVRKILEHLPQHRGMANALLNGDQSFQKKIDTMQRHIADDINTIDTCTANQNTPLTLTTRWQQVKNNWHNLKNDIGSISANDSFERHTTIITDILILISDCADDMHINNHPDSELQKLANTNFNLLPTMIEITGQARGIGAGAAAKGVVITATRIKLQFLHDKLGNTLATTRQVIENGLHANSAQSHINQQAASNSFADTQLFLNSINENLLANQKSKISAAEYFSEGSQAFDSNIKLFDAITAALSEDLKHRIPQQKNKLYLSVATGIILFIFSSIIWQQFILN